MAQPAPVTIHIEAIGSIPRAIDLIERVSRGEFPPRSSLPLYLVPLYEDPVRNTIERLRPQALPLLRTGTHRKFHNVAT
jgi:hypothetical protein